MAGVQTTVSGMFDKPMRIVGFISICHQVGVVTWLLPTFAPSNATELAIVSAELRMERYFGLISVIFPGFYSYVGAFLLSAK